MNVLIPGTRDQSVFSTSDLAISRQSTLIPWHSTSNLAMARAECAAVPAFVRKQIGTSDIDGLQVRRSIAYFSARESSVSSAAGYFLASYQLRKEEAVRLAAIERSG